jgi:hypothetical protein
MAKNRPEILTRRILNVSVFGTNEVIYLRPGLTTLRGSGNLEKSVTPLPAPLRGAFCSWCFFCLEPILLCPRRGVV